MTCESISNGEGLETVENPRSRGTEKPERISVIASAQMRLKLGTA
jgi:hypothetical protein